jgi:hypothetical protein
VGVRILVIRGGAIGDFILTLPAIRLLRENFPEARLEILGYEHIVALANGRFYAEATRSIEYGALAGFFIPGSELAPDLQEYFASFQQIISYLFDPDGHFVANLRRAGRNTFSRPSRRSTTRSTRRGNLRVRCKALPCISKIPPQPSSERTRSRLCRSLSRRM